MKKIVFPIIAVFASLAILSGCGASSSNAAQDTASSPYASSSYYATSSDNGGWMSGDEYPELAEAGSGDRMQSSEASSSLPSDAKLIYSADISLETTEFDSVAEKLSSLVESLGGYFERSSVDSYGSYRSGYYTVRVPAENFEKLCQSVGSLAQLNSISRSAEDVSESYYDVEARLKTQQTKLERLQELLAKAESMEDIITIESSISDTELQIEYLTGTLRQYDSLVGYSSVSISLEEVYRLSGTEEPAIGFGAKIVSALRHGARSFVSGLESFVLFVAENWAGIILVAVIAVAAVIFLRRRVRKIKIRKAKGSEKEN